MRHSSYFWFATLLLTLLYNVGCIGIGGNNEVQPTRYYTLQATGHTQLIADGQDTIEVGIDQIDIPDYLNRKEIALRTGRNELRYTERHLWAERPNDALERILTKNIERQSDSSLTVHGLPWPDSADPEIVLKLSFQSFEGQESPSARVLLDVSWTIQSSSEGTIFKQGIFNGGDLKWKRGDYSSLASGLSDSLVTLGQLIAADLDEVVDSLYQ